MKRFHVHVAVHDLEQSIRFYKARFDAEPTVKTELEGIRSQPAQAAPRYGEDARIEVREAKAGRCAPAST
jgi:catechol 2,3-dioxygenase-like lactoylglutathione lyase family enzyme